MVKNEKGYALLIVLFLVVVIMVISTTFVSASVSNAKQGKTVDENNLSVVAAEMGVDFYKTSFVNEFNKKKVELVNDAQVKVDELINSENFLKSSKNEKEVKLTAKSDEIRQYFFDSLLDHFDSSNLSIHYPASIGPDMYFERLLSYNVEPTLEEGDLKGVKIEGVVTGHNERQKKDLDFDITFIVPELDLGEVGEGGNVGFDDLYPDPVPTGLPVCSGDLNNEECMGNSRTSLKNVSNSTIYFPNGFSNENGNLGLNGSGSKLYVKTDFKVDSVNNMSETSLFIDGDFNAKGNANSMNNSLIKVNGSFTAKNMNSNNESTIAVNGPFTINSGMQGLTRAKVCVNNSFTVKGNMGGIESSDIYVNGPFTINGKIDGDNYNIFVNGSFEVDKKIEGNHFNIYVYNPEGNLPSEHVGKINVLDSSFVFPEECGFDATDLSWSLEDFNWDDNHEINVEY